jgi:hypothetical protein
MVRGQSYVLPSRILRDGSERTRSLREWRGGCPPAPGAPNIAHSSEVSSGSIASSCYPFYRRLEFCMLLNSGRLSRVLIAEPCIRNAVRMMSVVIRGEQAFASIACSTSLRFRGMRVRFQGLVSSRAHFPGSLESFPGLSRVHRTSKSRLAQGGKRRGT